MKINNKISVWENWLDFKDECRRRKVKIDIINKFEELLLLERKRIFLLNKKKLLKIPKYNDKNIRGIKKAIKKLRRIR